LSPGAKVTLLSERTGDVRPLQPPIGAFNFVAGATGRVHIEKSSMRDSKDRNAPAWLVGANEHVAAGDIQLQIGAVSETVTWKAPRATMIQSDQRRNIPHP